VAGWSGAVEVAVVAAVAAATEGDSSGGGVEMEEGVVGFRRCRVESVPTVARGEGAPEACGVLAVTDGVRPRDADGVGARVRCRSGDSVRPSTTDRDDVRSCSTSCPFRASSLSDV